MILAIDPGPKYSGVVVYDNLNNKIILSTKITNHLVFHLVKNYTFGSVLIETIDYVSSRVGLEVIETAINIGRFSEFFGNKFITHQIGRSAVKKSMGCKNDSEVRKYLIDKYGKEFMKKLKGDCIQAFALIHYYLQ